jgi:hypothetical protein
MQRAVDANLAFNRALRRQPADERDAIRVKEGERLDRLAATIRGDDSLSAEDTDKRLRTVDRLRARLASD